MIALKPTNADRVEANQRARTKEFLEHLLAAGAFALAPGRSLDHLVPRTRRILYVLTRSGTGAVPAVLDMLDSSEHVVAAGFDAMQRKREISASYERLLGR